VSAAATAARMRPLAWQIADLNDRYGLPLSRLVSVCVSSGASLLPDTPQYARFFGGDLRLISMDGYGTGEQWHEREHGVPSILAWLGRRADACAFLRRVHLAQQALVEVSSGALQGNHMYRTLS
jgi:hypothetical protein